MAQLHTIDVGPGSGVPLLMLLEPMPGLRLLAVEPDPVAYACLEVNSRGWAGVTLHQRGFLELEQRPDVQTGSFGVAASQAGLTPVVAMLISLLVYAGASQFLLISLLTSGAGLWTVVPTVLLMNARHVLYGPALAAQASSQHAALATPWLAFGLTDEVFATAMSKMPAVPQKQRDHWLLGLQIGAYAAWVGGTAVGIVFVREVELWPSAVRDGLAFVLPALFFSLLLEYGIRHWWRPILIAAGTAAVLGLFLASHHALVLAILAGALGQVVMSRRSV